MKDYEDYIQPPSYADSPIIDEDQLINKIKLTIQKDINQINGVYDAQILDSTQQMEEVIKKAKEDHNNRVLSINNQRDIDKAVYNKKAEKQIDSLINTMHNSPQKLSKSWWEILFGI